MPRCGRRQSAIDPPRQTAPRHQSRVIGKWDLAIAIGGPYCDWVNRHGGVLENLYRRYFAPPRIYHHHDTDIIYLIVKCANFRKKLVDSVIKKLCEVYKDKPRELREYSTISKKWPHQIQKHLFQFVEFSCQEDLEKGQDIQSRDF